MGGPLKTLPVKMVAVYLTIYYLLPQFLLKKKHSQFFSLFFISAIVLGLIHRLLQFYIIGPLYYPETYMGWHFWKMSHILYGILSVYTIVAVATAIKLLKPVSGKIIFQNTTLRNQRGFRQAVSHPGPTSKL